MKRIVGFLIAVSVVFGLSLFTGCARPDPIEKALEERRGWKVDLVTFLVKEDGKTSAQFRLTGPVDNHLEQLTVKVEQLDADGEVLSASWNTFDVAEVRRGGTVERLLLLDPPADGGQVESLRVDPLVTPDPSDYDHLPELQGLASRR